MKGFSLLETVLSIAIIGLLLGCAWSGVAGLDAKYRLLSAVWEVEAGLNAGRFRAAAGGEPVRVRFSVGALFLERWRPDRKAWVPIEFHVLPGVLIQANAAPVFQPQGTVSPLATIQVWNGRGRYRITLAITGRIKAHRV
jgi:prepilin-type N-terminal cleavage/methylation domain-containing protein